MFISGYFSVGKELSISKLKSQYVQIWSYSIFITLALVVLNEIPFGLVTVVSSAFPIVTSQYWFATFYFLLMLISPILKGAIRGISQKKLQSFLLTFGILWSVLPTLLINVPGYNNFVWFIFVYMLAAYVRIYPVSFLEKIKIYHGLVALLLECFMTVSVYCLGYQIPQLRNNAIYLFGEMNRLPAIIIAMLLFFGFKNSKIVNQIAALTFGVYLFHDNPNIREIIWVRILGDCNNIDNAYYIFHILTSIILVFTIGLILELIRGNCTLRLTNGIRKIREKNKNV